MGKLKGLERNQGIKKIYLDEIKKGKDHDSVMDAIALQYNIGRFYVRTILKEQGIEIERKTEYKRSDKDKLIKRDNEIVNLFKDEIDPDVIAKKFELTSTRVRQILRGKLGKSFKVPKLKIKLDDIKKELADGVSYENIVEKHGKNIIKQIKYNLNFNVFKKALEYKIKDIVHLAKSGTPPKDIAVKHDVTLNYTYMILHDNGIRSKISKEAKQKRDQAIWESKKKGASIDDIAEANKLTPTMVRIIISEIKNKSKTKKEKA
jgi:hypothetical protein